MNLDKDIFDLVVNIHRKMSGYTLTSIIHSMFVDGLNVKSRQLNGESCLEDVELDRVDREGYVYFIKSKSGKMKIGRTKNHPDTRLQYAKNQVKEDVELWGWMYVDNQRFFEELIHNALKDFHEYGEWFTYNEDVFASVIPGIFSLASMREEWFMCEWNTDNVGKSITQAIDNVEKSHPYSLCNVFK